MKKLLLFILLIFAVTGCRTNTSGTASNSPVEANDLTVSAAVSLKDAFNEIGALYKTRTGKAVTFNFGASGALEKQIETGAPLDVYASAGAQQMDELAAKDLIEPATRRDFARNELVLIAPQNSKTNLTTFTDLANPEIQKIAVGNPKTVPAGHYSEQLFEKTNLKTVVQAKLIFGEDVRQVLDYVVRGETDAGIVYASDARVAGEKVRLVAVAAENSHDPILYPMAIIKDSRQKQSGQEFLDLVLSREGQAILRKYGFAAVAER